MKFVFFMNARVWQRVSEETKGTKIKERKVEAGYIEEGMRDGVRWYEIEARETKIPQGH